MGVGVGAGAGVGVGVGVGGGGGAGGMAVVATQVIVELAVVMALVQLIQVPVHNLLLVSTGTAAPQLVVVPRPTTLSPDHKVSNHNNSSDPTHKP